MRGLLGAFREEDAIVGEDRHRHAVEPGKAADEGFAIQLLELMELRAIDEARNHFAGIIRLAHVLRHEAVQFGRVVKRLCRLG